MKLEFRRQLKQHSCSHHNDPPNSIGSTKKVYQNRGLSLDSNSLFVTTPIHSHVKSNESRYFVQDNASDDSKIDLQALDTESSLDYLPSDDEEDDEEYAENERKQETNEHDRSMGC